MPRAPAGVLALTLNSSLGGTEKSLLSLYASMDKSVFRPCIVTLIGDGSLTRLALARGLDAVHLNMRGPSDAGVVVRLAELFRSRDISILHTYLYPTGILGRLLGWACNTPIVICSQRSTDDWRGDWLCQLDRWSQGFVSCYLANCRVVAGRLSGRQRIAEDKIRVIQTRIEPLGESSTKAVLELRRAHGIAGDALVIGTVANLREAKGHSVLVTAAKKVIEKYPGVVFVWVGDGLLRKVLEEKIAAEGLAGNFRLVGFQADVAAYYRLFRLFVLPSLWEGLPLAVMEAMSAGLPIIASHVGGIGEIMEDGKEGRLIRPNDPDALATAMLDILASPEEAVSLGRRAHERFQRENSLCRYVHETERLYGEILESL